MQFLSVQIPVKSLEWREHPRFLAIVHLRIVSSPVHNMHILRRNYIPLSEYSLAISATASPILFLTGFDFSRPNASMSFCRITYACCFGMARNNSIVLLSSILRDLEAIRRKITAAKDRVYKVFEISETTLLLKS